MADTLFDSYSNLRLGLHHHVERELGTRVVAHGPEEAKVGAHASTGVEGERIHAQNNDERPQRDPLGVSGDERAAIGDDDGQDADLGVLKHDLGSIVDCLSTVQQQAQPSSCIASFSRGRPLVLDEHTGNAPWVPEYDAVYAASIQQAVLLQHDVIAEGRTEPPACLIAKVSLCANGCCKRRRPDAQVRIAGLQVCGLKDAEQILPGPVLCQEPFQQGGYPLPVI